MALNNNRKPRELPSVEEEQKRFAELGIKRGSLVKLGQSGKVPWTVLAFYRLGAGGIRLYVELSRGFQPTRSGRTRLIGRTVFSWEITELWKEQDE